MYKNSLVSIEDLSNEEIEDILDLAREMSKDVRSFPTLADGCIMSSLFFEPSTRTRGSFESAIYRLGGSAITTVGPGSSSMEKGETLVDTIRVWSGYSDVIVLRHPWEGSARLAADYASVPVINAGDGGHEHPTQTLCDLFTLLAEKDSLVGLRVALCGDLKHGRTVHSLILGLLRFGAELFFVPGEGLGLPEHVRTRIEAQYGRRIEKVQAGDFSALYGGTTDGSKDDSTLDAIYMTPNKPHQRTLFGDEPNVRVQMDPGSELVFYVTRRQVEREASSSGKRGGQGVDDRKYPRISKQTMKSRFAQAIVLHPLPRVDEISRDMDEDQRSKYFLQAGYGVPVRMALLSLVLGLKPWKKAAEGVDRSQDGKSGEVMAQGVVCKNSDCVTNHEPQSCEPRFSVFAGPHPTFTCRYCEWQNTPTFYGFQQSGKKSYKHISKLGFISQHQLYQFRFFSNEEDALRQGYLAASPGGDAPAPVYEVDG